MRTSFEAAAAKGIRLQVEDVAFRRNDVIIVIVCHLFDQLLDNEFVALQLNIDFLGHIGY